ncbi:ABC transporter ATP-binding protein [Amedibacillus sp. YH-ame10]
MLKLVKYLKPFTLSLIVIIALLFGQAQCELALPDYMSDIVDTGISKSGIEDGVPEVIRESEYQHLAMFMKDADKQLFEDNYTLLTSDQASKEQKDDYPALEKQNVYELKEIDEATRDKLSASLIKSELMVTGINQMLKDKESDLYKMINDETSPVYQMMKAQNITDPYLVFSMIPSDKMTGFDEAEKEIDKNLESMGTSVAGAAGASFVKAEYKAIGIDTDTMQNQYILVAGAKMLGIALGSAICAILVGLLASRVGAGLSRNLRKNVFEKVESFSNEEFNKFSTSSLITRTTNDIQQIQLVIIMFLRVVIYAPIIGIGAVLHVVNSGAEMTWIIALCVIVLLSLIGVLMVIAMPKFKMSQKLLDKLNGVTREFLDGMPVVRAFNTQQYEEEKFNDVNGKIMKNQLFINRTMSFMMPAMMMVMNGASLLIIWFGGHQIESGSIQVGDMLAFIQYSMQIIMAFLMIAMVAVILPRASVSAKRCLEVLNCKVRIQDPKQPKTFSQDQKGYIDFQNVSFRYPGAEEDVLHDINFTAKPGETTAFIGSTGSGKSTIINLVPRFFDVTEGTIRVDGVDIRDVSQHDLREKIGYVPQKGVLFSGDIESNLRYAKENATQEELDDAARIAQATEIIDAKPEKYATAISQGGTNVSGGQKQRLSIARALVNKPEIYIFDDSFSALDFKTDSKLRGELNKLTKKTNATVLLVAQRISSIMHAERIVVLDKGRVAGIGTHNELMKNCEVYQEIAYSQLSKEELGNE